jgi:two-component system cell cycle response regulator DivK
MARILLVEDDPDNIELMTRLLEHYGHQISVADHAMAGIATARAELPDLILMDLELPETLDGHPDPNAGLAATRQLKADPHTAAIPVIALTAHTMAQHRERIAEAGCDDLQEKPIFPFQSLLDKINRHALGGAPG